jgi:hypothetical protein
MALQQTIRVKDKIKKGGFFYEKSPLLYDLLSKH